MGISTETTDLDGVFLHLECCDCGEEAALFRIVTAERDLLRKQYDELFAWISKHVSEAAYNCEELGQGANAWNTLADSMFNGTMASFHRTP